MPIDEEIKEIKRAFRSYMDGVTAASLREKGCPNKVIWGVSRRHLEEIARQYTPDYALATGLWTADVRECKLVAIMLMPADSFGKSDAERWISQTNNEELSELLVFYLLYRLPFAPELVPELLVSGNAITRLTGLNLVSRLLLYGYEPCPETSSLILKSTLETLQSDTQSLRRAAMNCLIRFAKLGKQYEELAANAVRAHDYDFL